MCHLNDNLLRTKDQICFENEGSIKPDNFSQGVDNFCVDTMYDLCILSKCKIV